MERFVHASTISPDPFRLVACAVPQRCRQSHKDTRVDDLHAVEKRGIEDEGRFCFVLRARGVTMDAGRWIPAFAGMT